MGVPCVLCLNFFLIFWLVWRSFRVFGIDVNNVDVAVLI